MKSLEFLTKEIGWRSKVQKLGKILNKGISIAVAYLLINQSTQRLLIYPCSEPCPTFELSTSNQFPSLKPPMTSYCQYHKITHWIFCFCHNGYNFGIERMMSWILVLNKQFIPNIFKKRIMKSLNSRHKNPLRICFVCEFFSVVINIFNKTIHHIMFSFYTVKGWRDAPINIALLLEEPVGKSLYTYHVIRWEGENITKDKMDSMKTPCLPPASKYDSMHRNATINNSITIFIYLTMGL